MADKRKFGFSNRTSTDAGDLGGHGEDDAVEATAAISLEELGQLTAEPEEEAIEATAAISLDDLKDLNMAPAPAPAASADEDAAEATAAISLDQMRQLGMPIDEPPASAPAPPSADFEEENVEATAAISLDQLNAMGLDQPSSTASAPPPPPVPTQSAEPDPSDMEKTGAMSLDAMRKAGLLDEPPAPPSQSQPPPPPPPPPQDEPVEATAMLTGSVEDLLPVGGKSGGDEAPQATMMMPSPLEEAEPAAPPPVARVQAGNDMGTAFDVEPSRTDWLVGRGLDCDIVLNDASVSRKHFRFQLIDGVWKLKDLGSGNGTKVNGVRVDLIELFHGSVIDAGTTTLVWEQEGHDPPAGHQAPAAAASGFKDIGGDDGESTRVGDMAAMDFLKDWNPKQAEKQIAPPKKSGVGRKLFYAFALLAVAGGGFVAADRFAKLGIIFPVEPDTPVAAAPSETPDPEKEAKDKAREDKAEAQKLVTEALASFRDKKWRKARKLFRRALQLDPQASSASEGFKRAKAESKAERRLQEAKKAVEEESFKEALVLARQVGDTSVYFEEAKKLIKTAVEGHIADVMTKARSNEEAGNLPEAIKAVSNGLTVVKDAPELLSRLSELKLALSEGEAAPTADADASTTPEVAIAQAADAGPQSADSGPEAQGTQVAAAGAPPTGAGGEAQPNANTGTEAGGGAPTGAQPQPAAGTGSQPAAGTGSQPAAGTGSQPAAGTGSQPAAGTGSQPAVQPAPATTTAKRTASASNARRRSSATRKKSQSRGAAKKIQAALSQYASGNFAGAAAALTAIANSRTKKAIKSRARRLASSVTKFQSAYTAGMSAAKALKAGSAISKLGRARRLDASISGSYSGRIKKTLAKMHGYKASRAYASGSLGVAGSNARKALSYDASLSAAKKIYNEVQAKAQGWLDTAKSAANKNPDKAISLLQKVVAVLPRSDPRYKTASSLLHKLAEADDE